MAPIRGSGRSSFMGQAYARRGAGKGRRLGPASSSRRRRRKPMRRIAALLFAVLPAFPAAAEDVYPSHPITLITPYAPGGASDFLTCTLAEGLRSKLNQTVLVQNIGGAGGAVGSMQAARAKPDGYTLLTNHIGMSTIPLLYKKLNFDPLASYELIGLFAAAPMVILARHDFAPKNFAELVAFSKANKKQPPMATDGLGRPT